MPARPEPVTAAARAAQEGSGRRILALIAAIAFGFAGIWAYIFLSQKPPVAAGAINRLVAVPVHTELRQSGTEMEGKGGGVESTDQMLVLVDASVKNTAKIPLFPFELTGTLTSTQGEQQRFRALSANEMAQAFRAYPQLAAARGPVPASPLTRETTLKQGESEQGLVLFALPMKQADWEARRGFEMDVSFRWQRDLALAEPAPKLQP